MAYLLDLSAYAAANRYDDEYESDEWRIQRFGVLSGEISLGRTATGETFGGRRVFEDKIRLVTEQDVPPRIYLKSRTKQFPPFVNGFGAMPGVREDVREVIESFEPDAHNFVPFRLFDSSGHEAPQRYFYLNVLQYFECVIVEKSAGVKNVPPSHDHDPGAPPVWGCEVVNKQKLVMNKRIIGNHQLWRTRHVPFATMCCSDALWDAFRKAKITRLLHSISIPEIDEPWDPEGLAAKIDESHKLLLKWIMDQKTAGRQ
jgi:hypothetical protein